MKWNQIVSLVVWIGFIGSGCAFRESPRVDENPAPQVPGHKTETKSNPAPAVPEKKGYLSISGSKEDGKTFGDYRREFKEEKGPITITVPIPLPEKIPQELKLTLSSPMWESNILSKVTATGRLSLDGGIVSELSAQGVSAFTADNQPQGWSTKLTGIDKVLSDAEENIAYVQLKLYSDEKKDPDEIINFQLIAPPSKLATEQLTVSDFEAKYGADKIATYIYYSGMGFGLELMQVIRVKNSSYYSVVTSQSVRLTGGTLSSHMMKIDVNAQECSYSTGTTGWDEQLATDLYMLPLNAEVANDFTGFINQKLKTGQWEMEFQAGEEKLFGIYGQGQGVHPVVARTYPRPTFQSTQVVTHCKSRCPNPSQTAFVQYWSQHGWAGASHKCMDTEFCPLAVGTWTPRLNDDLCNQCREWDIRENHAWKDAHSGIDEDFYKSMCRGNQPGSYGWTVEKTYQNTNVGVHSDPVYLKLLPENVLIKARFNLNIEKEVSEERSISNLIQPTTVQLQ